MHTVIETPTYIGSLKRAGVDDDERQGIIDMLAFDPTCGDLIRDTGGARKVRFAKVGGGKSGGYRVITFFGGRDVPVFLLDIYGKGTAGYVVQGRQERSGEGAADNPRGLSCWKQGSCGEDEGRRTIGMTEAGKRLLQAANEALAIAEGRADPATYAVHAPASAIDVKAIRKSLNMTQVVFGERFGFGKARVRDWEQARATPTASDRVLLTTIKYAPDVVLAALQSEASPRADIVVAKKRSAAA